MSEVATTTAANRGFAFWVGGENLLAKVSRGDDGAVAAALEEVRIRIGTLLKTETVSFLLGAGASVDCGGPLLGAVPLSVEKDLCKRGIAGRARRRISYWLRAFYRAARHAGAGDKAPVEHAGILQRREELLHGNVDRLPVNFEQLLGQLHRWRAVLPTSARRLRIDSDPAVNVTRDDLDKAINHATRALADACRLPAAGKEGGLSTYTTFLRKVLTRPLNLKRVNVFTLNYDTLVEQAADAEGIVLIDGFVGTQRRVFRPECYEQDLYFPAETTEGRVHRFDRVLHLYKLHGSITWGAEEPSMTNPFGVRAEAGAEGHHLLIYPTPAKYGETLGMPYAELFRRFAAAIVRPQSALITVGYGFGDDHVNAIIQQALGVPSFTLLIVDPNPCSDFVSRLKKQNDQRVWIADGELGKFSGFVDRLLPDLRDQDIREKVLATRRALA
ncbi:MAG: hypothetical protein KatS3mg082_2965 [Nitrospiraceae bacterium]|nr:MAG: hypothetical protein KatS3mg082_2965 [Nitrospiraceae bacterium]